MDELGMKKLWDDAKEQFENSVSLMDSQKDEITKIKVSNSLQMMKPYKYFTVVIGIIFVVIGSLFIGYLSMNALAQVNMFFLISATGIVLLSAIGLGIYIYQLIKIAEVNRADTILVTQRKLLQLQTSTLWAARILLLQLPFWTTFWWNEQMFREWNSVQWLITGAITATFTYVAIWLFKNIHIKNSQKQWFQLLFKGNEWTPIRESLAALEYYETDKRNK